MSKYVLDEKGILTIIDEQDGGCCRFSSLLKIISQIIFVAVIVVNLLLFLGFYIDTPNNAVARNFVQNKIEIIEVKSKLDALFDNDQESFYGIKTIVVNLPDRLEEHAKSLEKMVDKSVTKIHNICEKVQDFINSERGE